MYFASPSFRTAARLPREGWGFVVATAGDPPSPSPSRTRPSEAPQRQPYETPPTQPSPPGTPGGPPQRPLEDPPLRPFETPPTQPGGPIG